MFAVVAGAGDVGRTVARALRADGHDVVLIEHDPRALKRAADLDILVIEGNAASPRIQEQASVGKADLLFAVTGSDEVNLLACALAKMKGVPTVCRLTGLDYADLPGTSAYRALGADSTACLEFHAAFKLARILESSRLRNVDVCAQGHFLAIELDVEPGSHAVGREIGAIPFDSGARAVGVVHAERFRLADPEFELGAGDRLVVLARSLDEVAGVESLFGSRRLRAPVPERVMVLGATSTGIHLARLLARRGKRVTLVEEDAVLRDRAAGVLDGISLVEGSPTDRGFLREEGVDGVDVVVGATDREEVNILACLIAKQLGKTRAIALLDQPELRFPVEAMGIDLALAPREDSVSSLLAHAHPLRGILQDLTLLHRGEGQVILVDVVARSRLVGREVRKAGLPKGCMLAGLVRASEPRIPKSDDVIRAGDRVVIVAEDEPAGDLKRAL